MFARRPNDHSRPTNAHLRSAGSARSGIVLRRQRSTSRLKSAVSGLALAAAFAAAFAGTAAAQSLNIIESPRSAPITVQSAPAQFYTNTLLIQFAQDADAQTILQQAIADTPGGADGVQIRTLADGLNSMILELPSAPAPDGGDNNAARISSIIGEGDPAVAQLPSTGLLERLQGNKDVVAVSRNYVMSIDTDQLNSMIGGGDENAAAGAQSVPDSVNQVIGGHTTGSGPTVAADARFPTDEGYKLQWHLKLNTADHGDTSSPGGANFPLAWRKTQGAPEVIVAVIDSGLIASHPDLAVNGRILPGYDFVSAEVEVANDGAPGRDPDPTEPDPTALTQACPNERDAGWHGSHVAGIAGAATAENQIGIVSGTWNIKILPVRALNKCGSGSLADLVDAMRWAAGISVPGVPDNPNPAHIVNLSLSSTSPLGCNPFHRLALDEMHARGVTVVSAAGNSGTDVATASPAVCKHSIAVAASDARGYLTNYSNFGDAVDILAPGGDNARDDNGDKQPDGILSLVKDGYSFYQGTSMATPLVAAAAALLKSNNPEMTPDQIRSRLRETALPRSAAECPRACGAGLLNLANE